MTFAIYAQNVETSMVDENDYISITTDSDGNVTLIED
jgi:hypothetical protein